MEHSADRVAALDRQDGCRVELCPEAEVRALRRADAHRQGLAASDAWDGVRRDEAAVAADHRGLHPAQADGVGKLAGREQDAPERHASHHRLELQAVLAEEAEPDVPELCKPVAVQFVERSCVAPAVAAPLALPPPEARSRKLPELQVQQKLVVRAAPPPRDALEELLPAQTRPALMKLQALPAGQ